MEMEMEHRHERKERMEKRVIYCTGCDRNVEVLLRAASEADSERPELLEAACLEVGWRCTGTTCPICATRPAPAKDEEPAVA
jgi:hypothetical protein